MKFKHIAAAAAITMGAGVAVDVALPSVVAAHHTTVACQSPGVWSIVNSEADKTMTFTTNHGHSGSIPAGGSTTVAYSGTELTVFGAWSNGVTNTNSGTGDCTVATTTTTTEATTSTTVPVTTTVQPSTTTTVASTTTLAPTTTVIEPSTTVTTEPTTTSPTTSSSVAATSTTSEPPSTTTSTTTGSSSVPSAPSSTTPEPCDAPPGTESDAGCILPICQPVLIDVNGDGDFDDANENSCQTGFLPATGPGVDPLLLIGLALSFMVPGGALLRFVKARAR